MYKNQLQELAQRSCFNLPSYSCIREGPDHAPRFKATVNFNEETFESPSFCSTLRQAEHAAAEVALNTLATRGPSKALAARVLDETGVYKNLLQETAHKAGLNLPVYTTLRTGPGHVPVFSCKVKLAGLSFTGEPARTKKQAQKNAAIAAWSTLKRLSHRVTTVSTSSSSSSSSLESKCIEEQEQVVIARFLSSLQQSGSKHFLQNDWQHEHQRSMQVCKDLTPQASSLYFSQCQSLAYPSFSPEMVLYQMFQQEQLLQMQNHLLTLPVSPAPPIAPHILPYMQSIVHPNHFTYVPAGKQEPLPVAAGPRFSVATSSPLYLSSQSDPEPIRSRSRVTIQEIHEEKKEESSKCSTSIVPESPVPLHTNAASRIKEPILDDGNPKNIDLEESKINVELESRFQNLHLEGNQSRQSEWTSRRNLDSDFRNNLLLQNSRGIDSSHSYRVPLDPPRLSSPGCPRLPPSAAAPVLLRTVGPVSPARPIPPNLTSCRPMPTPPRVRTGVPSHSTRPGNRNMHIRQVNPRFMAPAVRIRTVVPVCSAQPGQMPSSIQEGTLPDREKKNTVLEDISTASELDKLHK